MIAALALVGAETESEARRSRGRRSSYRRRSSRSSRSYSAYGGSGGSGYYSNCSQARAAGAAPIMAGGAGYSRRLDRDGDGIACE